MTLAQSASLTPDQLRVAVAERKLNAVVILEVMWDWNARTSSAGYTDRAPRWFHINPNNFTGRRLHVWLNAFNFKVTNACPELVNNAKGRGKPDAQWVADNLELLKPFDLLLVCGKVAQATYRRESVNARIVELLHPAARCWNRQGLDLVYAVINNETESKRITFNAGQFKAAALSSQ